MRQHDSHRNHSHSEEDSSDLGSNWHRHPSLDLKAMYYLLHWGNSKCSECYYRPKDSDLNKAHVGPKLELDGQVWSSLIFKWGYNGIETQNQRFMESDQSWTSFAFGERGEKTMIELNLHWIPAGKPAAFMRALWSPSPKRPTWLRPWRRAWSNNYKENNKSLKLPEQFDRRTSYFESYSSNRATLMSGKHDPWGTARRNLFNRQMHFSRRQLSVISGCKWYKTVSPPSPINV